MSQTIQIQALTPVDKWPARKLPQERFDTAVKRSMDQMSGMVGQLNDELIPAINSISPGVDTVVNNLSAIQAAPGHAASAAQSAMDATQKAGEAADSATAALEAKNNADTARAGAETARDAALTAKTDAETARDVAQAAQEGAETARDAAETARAGAETSETNAAADAATATRKAADAADSATAALEAKNNADTARAGAETARAGAETAQTAAEAARDEAQAIVGPTVPPTRTITAGTGLSGGGDLSADRTLAVNYGTAAGTVCQGNDERLDFAGVVKLYYGELDDTGKHPLVKGQVLTQWHVCDGTDGTPDMRDRVPIGASGTTAKGTKGGSATHTHRASVSVGDHAAAAISGSTASGGSVSASGKTASATPSISVSVNKATAGGTVGATTLTTNQMPSHAHRIDATTNYSVGYTPNQISVSQYSSGSNTYPTGGGQSHTHGFTGAAHTHPVSTSGGGHTHDISISGGNHSHSAGTLKTPALAHTASGSVAEATVLPPYVALHFIIFIN